MGSWKNRPGEVLADEFLVAAESSFVALSEHPAMGSAIHSRRPEFVALRKWRVRDFDNFLIFYEPRPDGVSIVRVLHGTQDWWRLIGADGP